MTLKSFLKRLILIEEKIEVLGSPVNGEISVYEDLFGKKTVRIDKVSQSGELVDKIWNRALREIHNSKFIIRNSLILGLGCGGCAKLVSKKWPEAKIIGVEIDPVVVEIGKKYFDMGKISNLKIVIGDAIKLINTKHLILKTKYNLILVDLYLGQEFPKEAESKEFLNGVKKLLDKGGVAIFNRLSYGQYQKPAIEFAEKLKQYFTKIHTEEVITNLLIFCSQ